MGPRVLINGIWYKFLLPFLVVGDLVATPVKLQQFEQML